MSDVDYNNKTTNDSLEPESTTGDVDDLLCDILDLCCVDTDHSKGVQLMGVGFNEAKAKLEAHYAKEIVNVLKLLEQALPKSGWKDKNNQSIYFDKDIQPIKDLVFAQLKDKK